MVRAAKDAGCKSVHIWNSKTTFSAGLARNVIISAKSAGLAVEGNDGLDTKAPNYRSLAARIKADCFMFTGEIENNGVAAIKDAGQVVPGLLIGPDAVCLNDMADPRRGLPPAIAARYKCTIATLDAKSFGPAGQAFFAAYKKEYDEANPEPFAIYGYEAMELTLDAVRRAGDRGNDRRAVIDEVFKTKDRHSVLGTYSIDPNGDTTLTDFGLYRPGKGVLVFDRVLHAQK
jgi:branched-chain amino acid transport system substrate-binding protein